MNIGIVGLGLIGGSFARTIKNNTNHKVLGFDIDKQTMDKAYLLQCIDCELTAENLNTCDFVIISVYPKATIDFVKDNIGNFNKDAIIFDCTGIKGTVCNELFSFMKDKEPTFIGGHPMAGKEFSGIAHASFALYKGASMILTPDKNCDIIKLSKLKDFILGLGFGKVVISTPDEHDKIISLTSQLCHVVSNAFVKNPKSKIHKGFSAGSFRDLTRVARLNEVMWTELFFDNKENLLNDINCIIDNLIPYRDALANNDEEKMKNLLKEGRVIKESLEK